MNKIKLYISAALLAFAALAVPASAQRTLPDGLHKMIVAPHALGVSYAERTLCLDVAANVAFTTTSDQTWATVREGKDGSIYVHLEANELATERVANITFANAENGIAQTLVITQSRNTAAEEIGADIVVKPSSATASNQATNYGIALTYDGDYSTFYHSAYISNLPFPPVTEDTPATLTYNFAAGQVIDYVNYVPRTSGNNGNFGLVDVYYKLSGQTDYTLFGQFDFNKSSSTSVVDFSSIGGLQSPTSIQFVVKSGYGNFASCAEMEFRKRAELSADYEIFADDVFSELKPGVSEDDILRLTDPLAKHLAQGLFEGSYSTDYRVASYPCLYNVNALADMWNTPGKYYDQRPGVTGISLAPGKHVLIVSGIPTGATARLVATSWYTGLVGSNFDGGSPQTWTFPLHNGVNTITLDIMSNSAFQGEYTSDYDALAYIDYNDYTDPDAKPDITVHFVDGIVNGYLSADKTNEEMHALTANAVNKHMDVVGSRVHAVWTAKGLNSYCKSTTGTTGYRQYINVLDSLVQWEHDLLGFTKYNRQPRNRTFAYVNYTYYMFQGTLGVSFHQNQESRVLNCKTLITGDNDAIWGLSHEWGHQHQMHPYFCWPGVTEVTNNVNSYYNIMKMGYRTSDKINAFSTAVNVYVNDNVSTTTASSKRSEAYKHRELTAWCPDYYAVASAMSDSLWHKASENKLLAPSYYEVGTVETLTPFVKLYTYFMRDGGKPSFLPDLMEALRQMDQDGGSTVEKPAGAGYDKYELIATAQNKNTNGAIEKLASLYPASVWNNYITTDHCTQYFNHAPYILNLMYKASMLSGYNLFPYFEQFGFLRQIATYAEEYGSYSFYILTPAAYNEAKADMDALVENGTLKAMPDGMVSTIANCSEWYHTTPSIPN